jgi:hypothetical protein
MSRTPLSIEDAMNIASVSHDAVQYPKYAPGDVDVPLLATAARQLVQEIYWLRTELENERARARDFVRPDAPRIEGHPLQEGRDGGGRRHFIGGRSVHCGRPLYLLTHLGWYSVRYEANLAKSQELLYFGLPGAYDESVIGRPRWAPIRVAR